MLKVPHDLNNKVSFTLHKRRFHFVEYTSVATTSNNEVVMTEYAIVYIIQGKKEIEVNGQLFTVDAGQLFILPKGKYIMSEYLPSDGSFQSVMLFFNHHHIVEIVNSIGPELSSNRKNDHELLQIFDASTRVVDLYKSLNNIQWGDPNGFGKELLDIKIKELIYLLLSEVNTRKGILLFMQIACSSTKKPLPLIVNENLYDRVSLCVLAAKCNMSVSTFKREFFKEFNSTPILWISSKRLEKAYMLIANTSSPIADIAYECGFENYIHFARRFRAKYGKSANSLRQKSNNKG